MYWFLFLGASLFQALPSIPQTEINSQVWKPFIQHFNSNNTEGFMAVHSKDVIRSPREAKVVWGWDAYRTQQATGDKQDLATNRKRTLELRFTERISNNDLAVEVGIYKTSYLLPNGQTQSFFGRFHVVLRKETGIWKILVDMDSTEGGTVGEKDFLAANPME